MLETIEKIFNSNDREEIKSALKKIIIEQIRYDISNYQEYFLSPDRLTNILEESFEEMIEEIKEEYKEQLKAKYEEELKRFMSSQQA